MNQKTTCPKLLKIIIAGEGGQGVQTIAKILAKASFNKGYQASYIPNFGTEQRGGVSLAYVQVSCEKIIAPKFDIADVFLIVSSRNIKRSLGYIETNTSVIYDKHLVNSDAIYQISQKSSTTAGIDAFKIAAQEFGERSFNIIILGILTAIVDTTIADEVEKLMNETFEKYYEKNPKLKEFNHKAFMLGLNMTQK